MNRYCRATVVLAALSVVAGGCRPTPSGSSTEQDSAEETSLHKYEGQYPMRVVCTTGQVAEMVARVGGEFVEVEALMGPGIDPHLYSPVASDVRKLSAADAIFYNGLHLEGRMAEMFVKKARSKATYAVTEGLQARGDKRLREPPKFADLFDPHVWHDPLLWSDCAGDVADMLAEFDPAHAEAYQANGAAYRKELAELDAYCRQELEKIPTQRRVLVTAHDAFGYFGQAYGVEVFGLKGISTEDEKDLKHQQFIQDMIIERQVPAVFVESAVAPKTVKALVEPCRAAGWDLKVGGELYADALGPDGTDDATYAGMLRHNVRTIVAAYEDK